jgi:hypothetical protein
MDPAIQAVPGYFVWQAPGQPVMIHLSINVVDRMSADILRGFGAVPKRGAEVGGILIGTTQPGKVNAVRIEDFEVIPCTYSRGPSYLLTDAERTLFNEVCQRRNAEIVGYYRSHTRAGLALQPEDIELLNQSLPSARIALLVKPFATKPSVGGFFVRENGVFPAATPLEFPFRRWEMTGEEPPRRPMHEKKQKDKEPQAVAEPDPHYRIFSAEPAEPGKQAREDPHAPKSKASIWMVASFVFLLLGVLLGYEASRITGPQRGASDFALSLTVQRTGENLTVHWNPEARGVRAARDGVLEIEDGGETKHVELDQANLSSGSMVYRNASNKVRFRLTINLAAGLSLTEMLDWPR